MVRLLHRPLHAVVVSAQQQSWRDICCWQFFHWPIGKPGMPTQSHVHILYSVAFPLKHDRATCPQLEEIWQENSGEEPGL